MSTSMDALQGEAKYPEGPITTQRIGFVGFGRMTFDVASAQALITESIHFLGQFSKEVVAETKLITQVSQAITVAEDFRNRIDVLVAQFTTFVDGRFIDIFAETLGVPVVVWGIREPNQEAGQRLSLNSLTGANMAGQRLYLKRIPFQVVYGKANETNLRREFANVLRIWKAYDRLHGFTVVTLGDTPDGFFFCQPDEKVTGRFGLTTRHLNLNETFSRALAIPDEVVQPTLEEIGAQVSGLSRLEPDSVLKFAKLQHVLLQDLQRLQADAVAIRCWPEFFTEFGAAACSTLSFLTNNGIMGACEADVLGALSMDVLYQLTDSPAYLGDLVEIDEKQDAVVFWHCGAGAFSLARPNPGAAAGRHPNRDIGFTLEFGLKPGPVTILRLGEDRDGKVRALVGEGEALDVPQRFLGTSGTVRLTKRTITESEDGNPTVSSHLRERVTRVMELGFEPHYALAYGHVAPFLEKLLGLLEIPVTRF